MKKLFVGLTVLSLMAMAVAPAMASGEDGHGGHHRRQQTNIMVTNDKSATVDNVVVVGAYTGGNGAMGGAAGSGYTGGDVESNTNQGGSQDNTAGNGGNGGNGGAGGTVDTGDADATAGVLNVVNTDLTGVEPCNCENLGDVTVVNRDRADVGNGLEVMADTEMNYANGNNGGNGGMGGEVEDNSNVGNMVRESNHHGDNHHGNTNTPSDQTNTAGDAGNGGNGGAGGRVTTGDAASSGRVINVVNTIVTRVR